LAAWRLGKERVLAIELSNGLAWSSQEKAKQHFREILARYADNEIISAPGDHDDLLALLERYDATVSVGQTKLGAGVRAFQRRMNRGEGWQTAGFWVLRVDNTETDFSFPAAISGKPKAQSGEFNDACRAAVAADIKAAKARHFTECADADWTCSVRSLWPSAVGKRSPSGPCRTEFRPPRRRIPLRAGMA
jgi:hypothetical protein